jgi:hypothetical protein
MFQFAIKNMINVFNMIKKKSLKVIQRPIYPNFLSIDPPKRACFFRGSMDSRELDR